VDWFETQPQRWQLKYKTEQKRTKGTGEEVAHHTLRPSEPEIVVLSGKAFGRRIKPKRK
jgi:hypothetical protein